MKFSLGNGCIKFLQNIHSMKLSVSDRAVALIWCHSVQDVSLGLSGNCIAKALEGAGYGQQNPTRISKSLSANKAIIKKRDGTFSIKINSVPEIRKKYLDYLVNPPVTESNSLLPLDLFNKSRGYIQKVVVQINSSYDNSLYDCCAVMCRRLLETLIIEVYEKNNISGDLKDSNGNYMMFSGLLGIVEKETRFTIGRSALKGLRDFKKIGDLSAHNRRFNARKGDIDPIQVDMRVASEEFLHLAGQC